MLQGDSDMSMLFVWSVGRLVCKTDSAMVHIYVCSRMLSCCSGLTLLFLQQTFLSICFFHKLLNANLIHSDCVENWRGVTMVGWGRKTQCIVPPFANTSSVVFVSSRWIQTLVYLVGIPYTVFLLNEQGFKDSLAVIATAAIRFIKCGTRHPAAPWRVMLLRHAILEMAKKPIVDTGSPTSNGCDLVCSCSRHAYFKTHLTTCFSSTWDLCKRNGS